MTWANYEPHNAMVKVHVTYHPHNEIPTRFEVTPARVNDITVAKAQTIEPGATYVFDLGYYDFTWFSELNAAGCRFVTRLKTHTRPRVVDEFLVAPGCAIKADRHIRIDGRLKSVRGRRHPLHAITLREVEVTIDTGKTLRLLTNDLNASADEIADLYKARWRIELFFRWVKQHLKIKRFLGVSENAIRVQIAVALIAYLLLKIAHQTQSKVTSLLTFARLIRANLMHLRPLSQIDKPPPPKTPDPCQPELALC
jgi:IS4 transposase